MEVTDLSVRGSEAKDEGVKLIGCDGGGYHPVTNPEGCINFGLAVNGVHSEMVKKKFESQILTGEPNLFQYFSEHGTVRLRKAMAEFMTTFFETAQPVQHENIYFMTSAINVVDFLAHCLADPEEVFLCASPVYPGIIHGVNTRAQVRLWPIPLTSQSEVPFQLTLKGVEEAYEKAINANKRVRGMILLNPGNPVGDVVPPSVLEELLKFCHWHRLHFISDEVYAMSIHDPDVKFHSVLNLPSLPDPERTHVVYGVSKDLGLTKLRVGVLHTYNKAVQELAIQMANFHCSSYPIMEVLANILEDREWCRTVFAESRRLLRENYLWAAEKLEAMNLQVHRTPAAVYLWVNFKQYCQPLTVESEARLSNRLVQEARLTIYPGGKFKGEEPGWFRIVFAWDKKTLSTGLQRLEEFLKKLDKENVS